MHLVNLEKDRFWHTSFEELPSPLYSASEKGLEATVKGLLSKSTNPGMMVKGQNWRYDALFEAASKGHLDILELLLKTVDEIPREVVCSIMSCFKVTESNKKKLPIILNLLWDKGCLHDQSRASKKIIDSELVEAAALIFDNSSHLLTGQLLDQKERFDVGTIERLLDRVIKSEINSFFCRSALVGLLFDKFDTDIKLTPSRMEGLAISLAAASDSTVVIAILNRWLNDIVLSEEFIGRISRVKRGNQARITQKVLITATREASDPQMINLLLERQDPVTTINKDVFLATARRSSKKSEFMQILFDACGSDAVIDDEIIQEIADNRHEGLRMMKLLICRQQAGFVVTKQTFCKAAMHSNREMMELLVNNTSGSDLPITEETLVAVAENVLHGEALIKYLFDLKGHDLPVSESLLVSMASIKHYSAADIVLAFILERWAEMPVTDELLEAACLHPNSLNLLLDRRHDCLPIRKMVQKAATDETRACDTSQSAAYASRRLAN
ncbi:uncharacterized protein N7483_007924 [Penicillium malachiteum]|uniref:uncharacterized protein n=1 Tax=Penicillium malachiteum TaxID=1324776 RepID=UPI00254659EF|nr:uncharacterized protein N7483_007924 [Penicillium malachiteum]KAJ5726567.1 hypothetical protein N7483_007924 [Penicillium malachiteum]